MIVRLSALDSFGVVFVQELAKGFSASISSLMILLAQIKSVALLRDVSLDIGVFNSPSVPEETNRTVIRPIT
jgi:hypothetical protein